MILKLLNRHRGIMILFFLYTVVNILLLAYHPGSIFNQPERFGEQISLYGSRDASLYAQMAWQLIREGIYGYNSVSPNAYVTPGQPFYLVAIFQVAEWLHTNHIILYRLVNMILNILTAFFVYVISLKMFKKIAIGIIATLFYSTHIAPLHYFRTALTETPTFFLFLLSILIFIYALEKEQYKLHILFGIVASILLMFRPVPAPLLFLGWGIILFQKGFKEGVKIGFIWCIGPLLIIFPWALRNYLEFGHLYLFSSHAGNPLLSGTSPYFIDDVGKLVQEANEKHLTQTELALQRIKQGFSDNFPLYFSWYTVGKTIWLFVEQHGMPDGLGPYQKTFGPVLSAFFKWQNIIVVFLGLCYSVIFRKRRPYMYLALIILIYIIFSNIYLTIPRYGLLIFPILSIIASAGIYQTFLWFKNKRKTVEE